MLAESINFNRNISYILLFNLKFKRIVKKYKILYDLAYNYHSIQNVYFDLEKNLDLNFHF